MKIVVTGIPGVGKTTVMKGVAEKENYVIINFGTTMFEEAVSQGLVEYRDDMRRLNPKIQRKLQKKAAQKIALVDNIIVDTHMTIKTPAGYLPGLPVWVLEELKMDILVLVEGDNKEIYERRNKDKSRKRDDDSIDGIKEHQMINRYSATSASILTGSTVKIIMNNNGKVKEAVDDLLCAIRGANR